MRNNSDNSIAENKVSLQQKLFLVFVALSMVALFFLARNVFVGFAQTRNLQEKETLAQKKVPNEPVNIISIKTDSTQIEFDKSFPRTNDWYKGLEIKIENTSDKAISYIALDLVFKRPDNLEAVSSEDKCLSVK